MAMGVLPGNAIELDANFPSFVFSVDYSQYAVDAEMAAAIIVKRGQPNSEKTSSNKYVPALFKKQHIRDVG
jgi:hypothetical protein